MASRGRHGGAPAREDEPRREERAEQQARAPQGPVLPPPLPVDYGVFMQGLVQAMQTQAHTQAALQAQLEAQASSGDPLLLGGSLDLGEGFPNTGLKLASTENQEASWDCPRRASSTSLIPLKIYLEANRNLASRLLAAKIFSLRPAILPSNSLNGQRLPLCLVGDVTPLEKTMESDSERGE
ncbi:hypothetical protein Taro_016406 [Colocasia esculenta]|uniref:Uncharacterized protein n=1 Tax=Colocasia esculenta TaxID=4460 RepID=A0A843UK75_COLES|nr:hypothetical protein [Colocasia esculenta]